MLETKEAQNEDYSKQNGKKSSSFKSTILAKLRPKREKTGAEAAKYTLLDVLRNRRLLMYALMMCFIWSVLPAYTLHM